MKIKKLCAALVLVLAGLLGVVFFLRTAFAENAVLTLSSEMTIIPDREEEVLAVTVSFGGNSVGAVSGKLMYDRGYTEFLSAEGYGEEGFQFTAEDDGEAVRFVWGDAAEAGDGSALMVFYFRPETITGEYAFSLAAEPLTACREENGKVTYFKLTPGDAISGTFEVTRGAIRAISLSESETAVVYGETKALPQVTYEPEGTSDEKNVVWSSSDEAVLGISDGRMQGLDPGKAVITATVPGRDVSAQASVRVLFMDVTDPAAWYFEPVYWALDNGVTSGYGEGTFQPNAPLTRAQTVMFLYKMAGSPDVSGLPSISFSDVRGRDWFHDAVRWAVAKGITTGYGEGTFQPNTSCTRAMIVTFLMRYAKLAGTYKAPASPAVFADVAENAWYKDAVDWAVANKVTTGYGQGIFSPNVTCTRAMMVTFLKRV
ncbi:MAG: S-layer homology domain-containing protein [Lachnospiraceae bacterium]|nr:S-layer homology domain-containing protein [Lachnospiraceae bacterium]